MEGAKSYRLYLKRSFGILKLTSGLCVLQESAFLHSERGGQMQQTLLPTGRQGSKPSYPQDVVMMLVERHCQLTT
jgi:hypothetical protein